MIKPGSVDWKRVVQKFIQLKIKFQKLDNCNYAVEIGTRTMNFKLVGIQGSNLLDGDKTFTLGNWALLLKLKSILFLFYLNVSKALVWQLMRAYTLSMLDKITGQGHPIVENGIIEWANNKVKK